MVDLDFTVESARFEPASLAPLILFGLRISNRTPALAVQNVQLQCQVRIEPARRRYGEDEQELLLDLFGTPERWGETLQSLLWAQVAISVPAFEASALADLPVPCSYDFNVGATKYFHGLQAGEAPLSFLFNGTVFYREDGRLQIGQIAWTKAATYRLPIGVWQAMMDRHHPRQAWLQLDRDVFERLYAYKRRRQLPRWEDAITALLASEAVP
jgi:hypothetical protein